jgi:hypothetical protein
MPKLDPGITVILSLSTARLSALTLPTQPTSSKAAMSKPPTTSHGRGGIGNHGPDSTNYVDGEIIRAGPQGDQGGVFFLLSSFNPFYQTTCILFLLPCLRSFHCSLTLRIDGPFSTGRGGRGNIGAKGSPVIAAADKDVIPPQATKVEKMESHHFGRGGAGNGTSKPRLVQTPSFTLFLLQGISGWKRAELR